MNKWVKTGLWIVLGVEFLAGGYLRMDPDFGWHLKTGEFIEKYGVPAKDPFTYTMPNFDFIDHEWLTNVLMWKGYKYIGEMGLAGVFSAMVLLTLALAIGRGGRWSLVPVVLGAMILYNRGGIRPQVIDWLFLIGLVRWYEHRRIWERWRWMYPLIMGIWVNLHGGFALGLIIMLFVMIVRAVLERKIEGKDVVVWALGVVGTSVNPYGPRVWYEVWMQMSDTQLRWNIAEWQPFFATVEPAFLMLGVFTVAGIWRYRREVVGWKALLTAGLLAAGLSSLRHVALFAVVAVGMMDWFLEKMYQEARQVTEGERRMAGFYKILVVIVGVLWIWDAGWLVASGYQSGWNRNRSYFGYPVKAVEWLRANPPKGEVFSEYGWGGYLIWRYPEKKVFIDGRGPSWRWKSPDERYADWAFVDYVKAADEEEWEGVFDKYVVTTVLWPAERKNPYLETINSWMARWGWKTGSSKKDTRLSQRLAEAGWKLVYEDETAVVYSKP